MQFMLLLHADESRYAKMTPEQMKNALAGFAQYNRDLAAAGVLKHGEQLKPSRSGKLLRAKGGSVVTTDGPYVESKEQMGGYYVLETATEAEALTWAARCPVAFVGTVEMRELLPQIR